MGSPNPHEVDMSRTSSALAVSAGREELRQAYEMRFVREIGNGNMNDKPFLQYLHFESEFIDIAAQMLGAAIRLAPSQDAIIVHAKSLYALVTDQREFFRKAFRSYGDPPQPSAASQELGQRLGDWGISLVRSGTYSQLVTFMYATEYFYFNWCSKVGSLSEEERVVHEWVQLHVTPEFRAQVEFLAMEVDQLETADTSQDEIDRVFRQTIQMEVDFHEAVYY